MRKRGLLEPRRIEYEIGYLKYAEGSCLAKAGDTVVLCAVSFETSVPSFLSGTGTGWLTAEYSLLPRSTEQRTIREIKRGRPDGRSTEISRFLGRSLRPCISLDKIGENTFIIDCDVIQADGGTRTLCVNAAHVALRQAVKKLLNEGRLTENPLRYWIGAISVGMVDGEILVDLDYSEDSRADVDMNVVATEHQGLIEVQMTAEKVPCAKEKFSYMVDVAIDIIKGIIEEEKKILAREGI